MSELQLALRPLIIVTSYSFRQLKPGFPGEVFLVQASGVEFDEQAYSGAPSERAEGCRDQGLPLQDHSKRNRRRSIANSRNRKPWERSGSDRYQARGLRKVAPKGPWETTGLSKLGLIGYSIWP